MSKEPSRMPTAVQIATATPGSSSRERHVHDVHDLRHCSSVMFPTRPEVDRCRAKRCFRSAIGWIENSSVTYSVSDLETLRAILLLAQFVALCPSRGAYGDLTGTALGACASTSVCTGRPMSSASTWIPASCGSAGACGILLYQFDPVSVVSHSGRPFGIIDESTRVQLSKPMDNASPMSWQCQ